MKKLVYTLLLIPFLMLGQNAQESMVIENVMLTVNPEKVAEFEAGIAAHNKKFHAEGPYGARVYNVLNGKNAGKYMLIMGPLPWSAMDARPSSQEHTDDNNKNVNQYLMPEVEVNYMKMHPELSNFSKDFEINKVSVFMIDVKRFKDMDFMDKVVKKVVKVYKEKMPDQLYGVYTNEMNNMNGMDFGWVEFFDNSSWMAKEDKFMQYFEEVHGAGSFAAFLADLEATTDGENTEVWALRKDLSGPSAQVIAATRQ
jgi:thiol-disulfide isomerase/thioredoxin